MAPQFQASIDTAAPKRFLSGVYQIRNTKNGKRYVGSSICIRTRFQFHRSLLNLGRHHSRYLLNSWIKNGEDSFLAELLEICDKSVLIEREQHYIDTLKPEYNLSPTAGSCIGVEWTEEMKEKARKPKPAEWVEKIKVGVKRSYEIYPELRQLRIDTFKAVRDADPKFNQGSNNAMYGMSKELSPNWGRRNSQATKDKRALSMKKARDEGRLNPPFKVVEQLSPEGELIQQWPSLKSAAKAVGCSPAAISNNCQGRIRLTQGFQWRYAA